MGGETDDDFHEEKQQLLYDTHIPTSVFQKALLAVGSAVAGLADPWRADMVAVNGEVLGERIFGSLPDVNVAKKSNTNVTHVTLIAD